MPKKLVEELSPEEIARIQEEEGNLQSVQFMPAEVKYIISPHSGSILADPEPVIELSDVTEKKARDVFNAIEEECGGSGSVPRDRVVIMLAQCGYDLNTEIISNIVSKRCEDDNIDERKWLTFLEEFQAPAYHYGQRLRKLCGRGQIHELSELIVRGCNVNAGDGEGLTPLHYAAELNRIEVIDTLVALVGEGLLVDAQDKYGWAPLHTAAHHGSLDCVEKLIKLGANIGIKEKTGKTPLHLAVAQVIPIRLMYLLSFYIQGRNNIVNLLLTNEASLVEPDNHGMTPLHDAAYKNQERTYHILGKNPHADVSLKDALGYTPAQYITPLAESTDHK